MASPPPLARRHAPPPIRPWRWGLRAGILGGVLAAFGASAAVARAHYLPDTPVLPGLVIDGETVAAVEDPSAVRGHVERHAADLLNRKIRFVAPGTDKAALEATLAELGVFVDVDATVALAERLGKDGDVLTRAEAAREARAGKIDAPLLVRLDRDLAMQALSALKEKEDAQPVSARLDLDKHTTSPEKDGRYVDADAMVAAVDATSRKPSGNAVESIPLAIASFAPRISTAFLKSLDVSTVVAEYETSFSRRGDQQRRGQNIDNAAEKLDGLVVSPGELVSFNDVIGERSEENGFQKSWEIFKGEMVEGVGGGTCQVASTFHAATFFGGFDVLERLPHSRPSVYIPMGLDSTVVYPGVDLKVRNPHPFPIVVHAKTIGTRLRIELLGKMRPVRVGFGREVLSTIPYKRKIEEDPALRGTTVMIKQHGIQGYKIKRERELTYPDGTTKKEEVEDSYPPTTEVYKVPLGFDVALLPPLPNGGGEDAELGGNPSAAPESARFPSQGTISTASNEAMSTGGAIEVVDAPGTHPPTAQQRDPVKTLRLRR